jgi:hypothetical protein
MQPCRKHLDGRLKSNLSGLRLALSDNASQRVLVSVTLHSFAGSTPFRFSVVLHHHLQSCRQLIACAKLRSQRPREYSNMTLSPACGWPVAPLSPTHQTSPNCANRTQEARTFNSMPMDTANERLTRRSFRGETQSEGFRLAPRHRWTRRSNYQIRYN